MDVESFYKKADVMLITSTYETFPMNLLEAKSFGIPLVVYDMPYLSMLQDRRGVLSVNRHDKNTAVKKITEILANPELKCRLREETKQSYQDFISSIKDHIFYYDKIFNYLDSRKSSSIKQNLIFKNRLLFWDTAISFYLEGIKNNPRGERVVIKEVITQATKPSGFDQIKIDRYDNVRKVVLRFFPYGTLRYRIARATAKRLYRLVLSRRK